MCCGKIYFSSATVDFSPDIIAKTLHSILSLKLNFKIGIYEYFTKACIQPHTCLNSCWQRHVYMPMNGLYHNWRFQSRTKACINITMNCFYREWTRGIDECYPTVNRGNLNLTFEVLNFQIISVW